MPASMPSRSRRACRFSTAAAKLEIEGLLRVWCKLHPESIAAVTLVGGGDVASDIDSLIFRKPS
jgi:hypothetical protein